MAWNPGAFRDNPDAVEAEALVEEGLLVAHDDAERAWLLLVRAACARLYRGSEPLGQGAAADPMPIGERLAAAEQAIAMARERRMEELILSGENVLGMLYGLAGNYSGMLGLARRQVADLRPDQSSLDQSDTIRKLATHLINVEADFEQGLDLGRRCRQLLGASGAAGPHQVMHTLWPILASLFFLGRWAELLSPLEEHLEAFRAEPAKECQFVRDGPAIGASALTLLGRGHEASTVAQLLGDPLADRKSASAWQARLAVYQGDPATARAIAHDKALEGRMYGPQHACVMLDVVRLQDDGAAATTFLPFAREAVPGNALIEPTADRLAGWLEIGQGNPTAATRWFRRALRGFSRFKVPYEEVVTLRCLADVLPPPDSDQVRKTAMQIEGRLGIATRAPVAARRVADALR